MHSSAYIKPFEEEMKEWEDKLISMQVEAPVEEGLCHVTRVAGYPGRVAALPGELALPGAHLQLRGHHEADAGGGPQVQQGHQPRISFGQKYCIEAKMFRLTGSGGTSWRRPCRTPGCCRPPASPTCWSVQCRDERKLFSIYLLFHYFHHVLFPNHVHWDLGVTC